MQSKGNYDVIFITWYNSTLIAPYTSQELKAERPPFIYLETRKNWKNDTFEQMIRLSQNVWPAVLYKFSYVFL
jgi:hypothetical protein